MLEPCLTQKRCRLRQRGRFRGSVQGFASAGAAGGRQAPPNHPRERLRLFFICRKKKCIVRKRYALRLLHFNLSSNRNMKGVVSTTPFVLLLHNIAFLSEIKTVCISDRNAINLHSAKPVAEAHWQFVLICPNNSLGSSHSLHIRNIAILGRL